MRRERQGSREAAPPPPAVEPPVAELEGEGRVKAAAGADPEAGPGEASPSGASRPAEEASALDRKILLELHALQALPVMARQGARRGPRRGARRSPEAVAATLPEAREVGLSTILEAGAGCFDGHRVLAVEKRISHLDAVRPGFRAARKLFLSHNDLVSLAGIEQFPELRVLSVQSNRIAQIEEIRVLASGCPRLEVASFEGNPLEGTPNYREHLLGLLPSLKMLDGAPVTERERAEARVTVSQEAHLMDMALENLVTMHKLERLIMLRRVHLEMFRRQGIGQRVFWRDRPPVTVPDTRLFLALWDFYGGLPESETRLMRTEINLEVVRGYNSARLRSGKRISWGHAINDVVMAQQNVIARLMALVDLLEGEALELGAAAAQKHNPQVVADKRSIQARLGSVSMSYVAAERAPAQAEAASRPLAEKHRDVAESSTSAGFRCAHPEQRIDEPDAGRRGSGDTRSEEPDRGSLTKESPTKQASSGRAEARDTFVGQVKARKRQNQKAGLRPIAARREEVPGTPRRIEQARRVRELEAEVEFQRQGAAVLESRNARLEEQLVYYHNQSAEALKSTEAELLGLQDDFQGALSLQDELEARMAAAVAERDAALCDLNTEREEVARLSEAVALVESLHTALAEKDAQVEWLAAEQERALEETAEQKQQTLEYKAAAEQCREMLQATLTSEERTDRVSALASRSLQRRFLFLLRRGAEAQKDERACVARAIEYQRWSLLRRWLGKLWKACLLSKRIQSLNRRCSLRALRESWGHWRAGVAQHVASMEHLAEVWTTLARLRAQFILSKWLVVAGRERIESEGKVHYLQLLRAVRAWQGGVSVQCRARQGQAAAINHRLVATRREAVRAWRACVAKTQQKVALKAKAQVYIRIRWNARLSACFAAWVAANASGLRRELERLRDDQQRERREHQEECEKYKQRSDAVDLENLQLIDRVHELSKELASSLAAGKIRDEEIEALKADKAGHGDAEAALRLDISRLEEELCAAEGTQESRVAKLREALDREVEKGAQAALKISLMAQEYEGKLASVEQQLVERDATVSALRKASTEMQTEVARIGAEWRQRATVAQAEAFELKRRLEEKELSVIKMQTVEANNHIVSGEERNRLLQNLAHLQEALSLSEGRNQELKTQVLRTQRAAHESQSVAREALGEGGNLPLHGSFAGRAPALEKSSPLAPTGSLGTENLGAWRSTPEAFSPVGASDADGLPAQAPPVPNAPPMSPQIASLHSEIQALRNHILRRIGPD